MSLFGCGLASQPLSAPSSYRRLDWPSTRLLWRQVTGSVSLFGLGAAGNRDRVGRTGAGLLAFVGELIQSLKRSAWNALVWKLVPVDEFAGPAAQSCNLHLQIINPLIGDVEQLL